MSFVWVSKKPKDGVATLYESNITLNKAASSHFDHAYSVLLGLDEDGKKIGWKDGFRPLYCILKYNIFTRK